MENIEDFSRRIDKNEKKIDELKNEFIALKEICTKHEYEISNASENIGELKRTYDVINKLNANMTILADKIEGLSQRLTKLESDNNLSVLGLSKDFYLKIILAAIGILIGYIFSQNIK